WPFASEVEKAKSIHGDTPNTSLALMRQYEPGVLDFGAVLHVALGAVRVAPPGIGPRFLRTVLGLALAASAIEVLGRLDPAQPESDALGVILRTLHLFEAVSRATDSPILQPFAADPIERARVACLFDLFESSPWLKRASEGAQQWDGAYADE